MRKIFLVIFTLIISSQLFAQTKNQILLYGSLTGSYTKGTWGHTSSWMTVAPGVGYNLSDRWTAGLMGSYRMDKTKDTGVAAITRESSSYSIGLFGRYTQPLSEIFFIFGQLDLGYGRYNGTKLNGVKLPLGSDRELTADFYPSVGVNLKNGFALNFAFGGLNFRSAKSDAAPNSDMSVVLNFGHAFRFGISKFFGGYGRDALRNRYDY